MNSALTLLRRDLARTHRCPRDASARYFTVRLRQILDSNDVTFFFAIAFIVSFGFTPRVWRLGSSKGVVAASRRLSAAEPSATSPVEKFRADESRSFKCFRAFTAAYQMFLLTPLSPSLSPCSQCTNTYADQNAVFHPHSDRQIDRPKTRSKRSGIFRSKLLKRYFTRNSRSKA
jgi:hypothetical protein